MIKSLILVLSLLYATCVYSETLTEAYGTKVSLTKDTVHFPDFSIRYLDKVDHPPLSEIEGFRPNAKPAPTFEFEITSETDSKKIRWGAGFGDISPERFAFNAQCFDILVEQRLLLRDQVIINKLTEEECMR